jgi:hypothetical protein
VIRVTEGVQVRTHLAAVDLVVQKFSNGTVLGSLYEVGVDEGRSLGRCLCGAVAVDGYAHTKTLEHLKRVDLWIGGTAFELPWLELLKVADFLRLSFELPHPPEGTLVPA